LEKVVRELRERHERQVKEVRQSARIEAAEREKRINESHQVEA
jgi:hypothetical protein